MKLQFFGPLGIVTGSCAMLSHDATRLLVDCGAQQGEPTQQRWNEGPLPFDPTTIDLVVLTHAHIDHSGLLPRLAREGFRGRVVCTVETAALVRPLLEDAARHTRAFDPSDVHALQFDARPEPFGVPIELAPGLELRFHRTAHILGAASAQILWSHAGEKRAIVFSGDLGPHTKAEPSWLLSHRSAPPRSDFAVIESTYGARTRRRLSHDDRLARLRSALLAAVERNGPILVPAFAADRFPSVVLDLAFVLAEPVFAKVPFYLQSQLARQLAAVYASHLGAVETLGPRRVNRWLSDDLFRRFALDPERDAPRVAANLSALFRGERPTDPIAGWRIPTWVETRQRPPGAFVVVAAGGMCDGGTVVDYLANHVASECTTVLMTGYAAGGSVARQLQEIGRIPLAERRTLDGRLEIPTRPQPTSFQRRYVRAHVETLEGYSAHADQSGLLSWLFPVVKKRTRATAPTVFVQHGDDAARETLARAIHERAPDTRVVRPTREAATFDLDTTKTARPNPVVRGLAALETRVAALEAIVEELRRAA